MAKRNASKELNHDNWADEDEPEDMGTFRQASEQQLAGRQIRKARRRGAPDSSSPMGIFKGLTPFSGFGNKESSQPTFSFLSNSKETSNDESPKPAMSFFSNLSNSTNSSDSSKSEEAKKIIPTFQFTHESSKSSSTVKTNGLDPGEKGGKEIKENGKESGKESKQFLSHLKSLNEGVLKWVQQHVEKNPHVDLTPVFDDYKKHFDGLVKKYPAKNEVESTHSSTSKKENKTLLDNKGSSPTPAFSFGASKTSPQPFSFGVTKEDKLDPTAKPFSFMGSSDKKTDKDKLDPTAKPFSFMGSSDKNTDNKPFSFGTEDKDNSGSSTVKPLFSFGQDSKSSDSIFGKSGFVFGAQTSNSGFSFTKSAETEKTDKGAATGGEAGGASSKEDEPSDEPPKIDVKEVKEEDALYEKKCKLFYMKDGAYVEKGLGTLFLKPADDKTQLLVRAMTNLGNILLNIFLTKSIPAVRAGNNGIIIACIPNPPIDSKNPSTEPVKMLIKVKTREDADHLLEKINEYKK